MFDSTLFRATDDDSYEQLDTRSRLQTLRREAEHDEPTQRLERNYSVKPPDSGRSSPLSRFAERWLPESLLRSRVDPGRAGVLAIGLVVVVLLGVLVLTWSGRPTAESAPPPLPPAPPPVMTSTTAPAELVVSVVGRVTNPGLVTVPAGSRIADAVTAAGGPLPDTDLTSLNLARRLADGEQLYVAIPVPPGAQTGQSGSGGGDGKLDLNAATKEQLDGLPGVGEVTAERILQWRTEHGRFDSVDQLREVGGIGDARLSKLRDLVRV
ncbi:ComEA family DNA-binding protein [Saccharopolyspora rhizosphaerae]|uniref:ComEA family DNA-binding protein n=1 Tax=Saccharopolyspora rhizosphaerae TaxID=2492662 RepID=A0A3R8R675_9PSEU|nr:ComEA family DNA-binding protein [Saccharopolyspora rhizosphaerae]RRO19326.1 ComEA family DNA-binding protein [Saccharopolyspora rhizosphaerae]